VEELAGATKFRDLPAFITNSKVLNYKDGPIRFQDLMPRVKDGGVRINEGFAAIAPHPALLFFAPGKSMK
jgi:hypothetical protein